MQFKFCKLQFLIMALSSKNVEGKEVLNVQLVSNKVKQPIFKAIPNIVMYSLLVLQNQEIKKQVQELIEKGIIHPSTSPCGSPIVLVPKKDGTWRMCIEYKALKR